VTLMLRVVCVIQLEGRAEFQAGPGVEAEQGSDPEQSSDQSKSRAGLKAGQAESEQGCCNL
jgi:hypothetical protein